MSFEPNGSTAGVRRLGLVLLLVVVGSTWISPSFRDLVIGDETKYSRVVEQLGETGSWLVLRLDGRAYGHKPPLHFWILGATSKLFGLESIWTFVLPSLVAFILLIAFVVAGQRRLFGRGEAAAAFVFGTFWLSWGLAQSARMDVLFVACLSAAAVEMFRGFDERSNSPLDAAGIWTGIAVLLKGPIAILIVSLLFAIESYRRVRKVRGRDLAALIIAVGIPLAWFVPAALAGGTGYARELLVRQTLDRAFRSWVHSEPPWFYVLRFPLTFFPWFAVIVVAAVAAVRTAKRSDRNTAMFCISWFASVVVPFSLVSGKLDIYMLPAMVPAAMLCAWLLEGGEERWQTRAVAAEVASLALVASAFVAGLTAVGWFPRGGVAEAALLDDPRVSGFFWCGAAASIAGILLVFRWRRTPMRSTFVTGMATLLPMVWLVTVAMPALRDSITTAPLIRVIEREGVDPADVALYWTPHLWEKGMNPSMHGVHYVGSAGLESTSPRVVIARRDRASELGDALERFERAESLHLMGKDYDVYRRIEKR